MAEQRDFDEPPRPLLDKSVLQNDERGFKRSLDNGFKVCLQEQGS